MPSKDHYHKESLRRKEGWLEHRRKKLGVGKSASGGVRQKAEKKKEPIGHQSKSHTKKGELRVVPGKKRPGNEKKKLNDCRGAHHTEKSNVEKGGF